MKKFYVCEICGNFVGKIHDAAPKMVCCGQEMKEIVPNTVEASVEKHLPVVTKKDGVIEVKVGSVEHPMEEKHYIDFIYLETKQGAQRKVLKPGDKPEVKFAVVDDEALNVYAYCNLHGLWKTEIK